ncbi:MAG: tetratricopeptide repeat protein [Muribaculaceae bacterium]|nr:tetratricopeptide repeat protein [Muribaculaceae bacterium]
MRKSLNILYLTFTLVLCAILAACSTKKNTPVSRQWQAFNTRYNVYFNGKTNYDEQLQAMEQAYQDDYTRITLIHPAEAYADPKRPRPTGSFDRTIEKMQKAIQLHSIKKKPQKKGSSAKEKAFRARDEFNPFLHNAWLTMGKAQYFKGDFSGAATTFLYISKHFTWLPQVVTEARIWMGLCYCALDWTYEAENVLRLVKEKDLTSKNLKNLYALAQGNYYVRTNEYDKAVKYISQAAKYAHGSQKNRLWFLLGQLYSNIGRKREAYEAFKKAGSGIATDYRTKFNARIKRSEVFEGGNINAEVRSLKSMAHFARNNEFLDQIYYAIGNLYLSRRDTVNALDNYRTAVEKSTRNGIDKAMAQLALGNIYFDRGEYVLAQPCYAEAIPQLPESFPQYKKLKLRSDVLDELALYAGNVQLQDSLLTLSKMTPEEQLAVAERLVKELKDREKKEAEEAKRAEYLAEQEGKGADGINKDEGSTQNFISNADKSWYFYNTMTKNQGKTEFQRRWGSRKLEDDWRRRNKTTFSLSEPADEEAEDSSDAENPEGTEGDDEAKKKEKADAASDPHNPEYYLAQIPKTEEEINTANDVIKDGLYNMGLILKDRLEDYPAARKDFNELLQRYPDNIYRLDVYYNMYLMAVRQGQTAVAESWRQKILQDFPDSPYGIAMKDPAYFDNLRRMNEIQEDMYQEAYDAYLADRNQRVHSLTAKMETDYPLSKILPKFLFIDALSYLTEDNTEKFKDRLTTLLDKYPDTDMTDVAGGIMKGLRAGRTPKAGLSNTRGMIWEMKLGNDSISPLDGQPANFERNPDAPQYLVLAFPRDSVNANLVLYDVARFNFSSFVVRDFDLEPMSFGNVGLLIIKGFDNMKQLEHYRAVMTQNNFELPEGVRPIMISKANFELLLREGRSFEEYFRFEEETPPDDLPPVIPPDEVEEDKESELPDQPEIPDRPEQPELPQQSESSPQSESSDQPDTTLQ